MNTTIVITPRERFTQVLVSMQDLFRTIPTDVPVIVIDSGCPEDVRAGLRELARKRPFRHIECRDFLLAPQVRNMALEHVETEYVCYCDNDLRYTEGWLEALEACAERTGAGAVMPVTLFGLSPHQPIHQAGAVISVVKDDTGAPRLKSHHRLEWEPLQNHISKGWTDVDREADEFEYHCVLLRASVVRGFGGHDERQVHHDHFNDSLQVLLAGYKVIFEPEAVIIYNATEPFTDVDWPYFLFRWNPDLTRRSEALIGTFWGVRKNRVENELKFLQLHRRRAAATTLPRWLRKKLPGRAREWLIDRALERALRFEAAPVPMTIRVMQPQPPTDALLRIGIPGAEQLL